jgi:hypothetical protein
MRPRATRRRRETEPVGLWKAGMKHSLPRELGAARSPSLKLFGIVLGRKKVETELDSIGVHRVPFELLGN